MFPKMKIKPKNYRLEEIKEESQGIGYNSQFAFDKMATNTKERNFFINGSINFCVAPCKFATHMKLINKV